MERRSIVVRVPGWEERINCMGAQGNPGVMKIFPALTVMVFRCLSKFTGLYTFNKMKFTLCILSYFYLNI